MKPLYTKKNGTSQRVAAIEVKMPASYPASRITRESVSVTADGVKTYTILLSELYALVDLSKITHNAALRIDGTGYYIIASFTSSIISPSTLMFNRGVIENQQNRIDVYKIMSSGSTFEIVRGSTYTNMSNDPVLTGLKLSIIY